MKVKILFILLCIPAYIIGQTVAIAGDKKPVYGKVEVYIVENHAKTSDTNARWTIVGGEFSKGGTTLSQDVDKSKVEVIWKDISNGELSYSYQNFSGKIKVTRDIH